MAIIKYHQTVSPSVCNCVYEEQFDFDTELNNPVSDPSLWFFHNVCERHLPLVSNKQPLKKADLDKKKEDATNHQLFLLSNNRTRHLKQWDEHPKIKGIKDIATEMKKSPDSKTRERANKIEAVMDEQRRGQERFLDKHEDDSMNNLLLGIHSPYAFNAQEVYDAILEEFKANA